MLTSLLMSTEFSILVPPAESRVKIKEKPIVALATQQTGFTPGYQLRIMTVYHWFRYWERIAFVGSAVTAVYRPRVSLRGGIPHHLALRGK